jgi:CDGSH-type Zn-finger protein
MATSEVQGAAKIKVQPNGPYVVSGAVPVTRRSVVRSEHGEPTAWRTTADLSARNVVALCRCGGSANKPFCDGTHAVKNFDGTETATGSTYDERAKTYQGAGVVVRDDRSICEHAGFCGNRLTNVWEMVSGSGTEDSSLRSQMMAMIEHCPSGALTYRLSVNGPDVEPELPAGIAVTDDGPYFVTGGLPVERSDGKPFEPRPRVTLCRCGGSANKPLCDGSHKDIGFRDS